MAEVFRRLPGELPEIPGRGFRRPGGGREDSRGGRPGGGQGGGQEEAGEDEFLGIRGRGAAKIREGAARMGGIPGHPVQLFLGIYYEFLGIHGVGSAAKMRGGAAGIPGNSHGIPGNQIRVCGR